MSSFSLNRDGVSLAGIDFGGRGASVLMLHGLAGYAGEWRETAAGLAGRARVVALDARGHGASERRPSDASFDAGADDAIFAVRELSLGPTVIVGQSLGGQVAMLAAAAHPETVRGLVVAEADPTPADSDDAEQVEAWLHSWPRPFRSAEEAQAFFAGTPARATAWAAGLEQRADGLWPRFDVDIVMRSLRGAHARSLWAEWGRIACPALVVRGAEGDLEPETAAEMLARLPEATLAEIPGAGHDVHLDQPAEWVRTLKRFLAALD